MSTKDAQEVPGRISVDYLVGGFRISLGDSSNTPGPRTHIEGFNRALQTMGHETRVDLVSNFKGMARFAKIREARYEASASYKVRIADAIRFLASIWCGLNVSWKASRRTPPDLIYERLAVFQSLTSFHPHKKTSFRVVEANGILSRETAIDRHALKAEWYARWLEKRVLRRADKVVAVSENLKNELIKFAALDPRKIVVIPNGIKAEITRVPRTTGQRKTLGFVGAIVAWQHLDRLVTAVYELNQRAERAEERILLELIGDGPELESLRSLVKELNMHGDIKFRGRLSHDDAIKSMTGWDVGFAGHEKSSSGSMYHSPLKVYEYAALGVSVLCTPSDDASMLKKTGSHVQFISEGASSSELEDVVKKAFDERGTMSEQAIESMRDSVRTNHAWEQRVALLLDAIGVREKDGPSDLEKTVV